MKPAVRNKNDLVKAAYTLSDDEMRNISALGDILRGVRARLKKEGVNIAKLRKKLLSKQRNKVKYGHASQTG